MVIVCVPSLRVLSRTVVELSSSGHLSGYQRSLLVWRDAVFNVEIGTSGFLLPFQIGITLQPVALHKNVYASVVEDMILKVGVCWQQRVHEPP